MSEKTDPSGDVSAPRSIYAICATCLYFRAKTGEEGKQRGCFNSCLRFPPNYGAWWAIPEPDDWCAEHRSGKEFSRP